MLNRRFSLCLVVCFVTLTAAAVGGGATNGKKVSVSVSASPAACCVGTTGNVSQTGTIDLTDLAMLIGYLTITPTPTLPCPEAANVTGSGTIDLTDLAMLIGYLTIPNVTLPACPADTSLMDPTIRMSAVAAVENMINSLGTLPSAARNQQILTFMQGRPEFDTVGISPSGNNVFARFTDGVMYIVGASFGELDDSLPGETLPNMPIPIALPLSRGEIDRRYGNPATVTASSFDDLPSSTSYRVLQTVGTAFQSAGTTTNRLRNWLSANGYVNGGNGATVEQLRTVGGDGVLFYVGHGGDGIQPNGILDYGIWSSTIATVGNLNGYAGDLRAGRLCLLTAARDTSAQGTPFEETHFAITSRFVSHYWANFAPNAMVMVTACASDSVPAFRNAIQAKGGPAYFGWDASVDCRGACYASEFLIDRFLGANKAFPRENPKQRAFDVQQVFADLESRNFHIQPGGDDVTTFTSQMHYHLGASNFGLLAPSIRFMAILEDVDTLYVTGYFGTNPNGTGKLIIGGTEMPIALWEPQLITAVIPNSGVGSVGPVTVDVDGRVSNTVNITEWNFIATYRKLEAGSMVAEMKLHTHLRVDAHLFREAPHQAPVGYTLQIQVAEDSYGEASATGTYTYRNPTDPEDTTVYDWAGSCFLPGIWEHNPAGFWYTGPFNTVNKTWQPMLIAQSPFELILLIDGEEAEQFGVNIYDELYDEQLFRRMHFTFDSNWNLNSYSKQSVQGCCSYDPDLSPIIHQFNVPATTASWAPDPQGAR